MHTSRLAIGAVLLLAIGAAVIAHEGDRRVVSLAAGSSEGQAGLVDGARLLGDVRLLASADFDGRRTGTAGSLKARAFLQQRYAALGLLPFGSAYAQPFSFSEGGAAYPDAANYIGFIRGSASPERFIVVSAHYDHLGRRQGLLYPGADDNASGVAALLAVAAYFSQHPPRHTIVFAAFDGEELGLRGARAFVGAMPFAASDLALALNFDMLSHNERNEIFAAGSSYTPALAPLLAAVARRHRPQLKLGHDHHRWLPSSDGEDWTDSSDHGPFHQAGVPFLYFGVEDHADYHQPSDTFEHINQAFFVDVARLLVDVAASADRSLK